MILRDVSDGGDFHPSSFPILRKTDIERLSSMDYAARATFVYAGYFTSVDKLDVLRMLTTASATFEDNDPVPVVKVDDGLFLAELWHGRSADSSDVAASTLSALINRAKEIKADNRRPLIVTTDALDGMAMSSYADDVDVLVIASRDLSPLKKRRLLSTDGIKTVEFDGTEKEAEALIAEAVSSGRFSELKDDYFLVDLSDNIAETVPYVSVLVSAYCDLVASEEITVGDKVNIFLPKGEKRLLKAAEYALGAGLPIGKIIVGENNPDFRSKNVSCFDVTDNEIKEEIEEFYDDFDYVLDARSASASAAYFKYLGEVQDYTPSIVVTVSTPYDDPLAVCRAILGENEKDASVASKKLREFTGVEIPSSLAGVWSKKVSKGTHAGKEDLIDVILNLYRRK